MILAKPGRTTGDQRNGASRIVTNMRRQKCRRLNERRRVLVERRDNLVQDDRVRRLVECPELFGRGNGLIHHADISVEFVLIGIFYELLGFFLTHPADLIGQNFSKRWNARLLLCSIDNPEARRGEG